MKPNEENVISNPVRKVIDKNVVLSNYIIKSPPKEKQHNALVRWCMRWFVLYYKSRVCWLFYYQNEESYCQGNLPKGKIDVKHCKIKIHRGDLNKYEYVIDLIGVKRTYYLCFTNSRIFKIWLEKLQEVHKYVWEIHDVNKKDVNNNNDVNQNNAMNNNMNKNNPIAFDESKQENKEADDKNIKIVVDEENCLDLTQQNKDHDTENDKDDNTETFSDEEKEEHKCCSDTEDDEGILKGKNWAFPESNHSSSVEEVGNFQEENAGFLGAGISPNRPKSCTEQFETKKLPMDSLDVDETYSTPKAIRKNNITSHSVNPQRRLSAHFSDFRDARYDSLPNLAVSSTTGNSNIHFEILERLKAAASKRPSLVNDYDMGGFSGPKLHFSGT